MMVSNCSGKGERSFSKPKRIKDEIRNRMGRHGLDGLSIVSGALRGLDFSKFIDKFSRKKSLGNTKITCCRLCG